MPKEPILIPGTHRFRYYADVGETIWVALREHDAYGGNYRTMKLTAKQSWSEENGDSLEYRAFDTEEEAQWAIDRALGTRIRVEVRTADPEKFLPKVTYDHTNSKLLALGSRLREDTDLIPPGLLQALPRLTVYGGKLAAEFWYYTVNMGEDFGRHEAGMYVLADLREEKVLLAKPLSEKTDFSECRETYYSVRQQEAEQTYLQLCQQLLSLEEVSENDVMNSRVWWHRAQPKWMKRWLREQQDIAWKTAYAPYTDAIRFDVAQMRQKRVED